MQPREGLRGRYELYTDQGPGEVWAWERGGWAGQDLGSHVGPTAAA